jgi:hypothetical protein
MCAAASTSIISCSDACAGSRSSIPYH